MAILICGWLCAQSPLPSWRQIIAHRPGFQRIWDSRTICLEHRREEASGARVMLSERLVQSYLYPDMALIVDQYRGWLNGVRWSVYDRTSNTDRFLLSTTPRRVETAAASRDSLEGFFEYQVLFLGCTKGFCEPDVSRVEPVGAGKRVELRIERAWRAFSLLIGHEGELVSATVTRTSGSQGAGLRLTSVEERDKIMVLENQYVDGVLVPARYRRERWLRDKLVAKATYRLRVVLDAESPPSLRQGELDPSDAQRGCPTK